MEAKYEILPGAKLSEPKIVILRRRLTSPYGMTYAECREGGDIHSKVTLWGDPYKNTVNVCSVHGKLSALHASLLVSANVSLQGWRTLSSLRTTFPSGEPCEGHMPVVGGTRCRSWQSNVLLLTVRSRSISTLTNILLYPSSSQAKGIVRF